MNARKEKIEERVKRQGIIGGNKFDDVIREAEELAKGLNSPLTPDATDFIANELIKQTESRSSQSSSSSESVISRIKKAEGEGIIDIEVIDGSLQFVRRSLSRLGEISISSFSVLDQKIEEMNKFLTRDFQDILTSDLNAQSKVIESGLRKDIDELKNDIDDLEQKIINLPGTLPNTNATKTKSQLDFYILVGVAIISIISLLTNLFKSNKK